MTVTLGIVIITCVISIACFNNRDLFAKLKHFPVAEDRNREYYRWLTSGFVHGDFMHLFVNMFVLHEFGRVVEDNFSMHFGFPVGQILFLVTYLLVIVMGDIPTFYRHKGNHYFSSVGASGGVAGILFIYILLHPWSMLGLFAVIPVPAILFGVLYIWYSSWASNKQNDMIDHEAHMYGAIAGMIIAVVTRPNILPEFLQSLVRDFPF